MKVCFLLALALTIASQSGAVIETYEFSSSDLKSRYFILCQELRCPKCQNQNIADSNSPISRDLRAVLYQQLEAGATNDEILQFMVERYGEFVRYRPRFDRNTLLLWVTPGILILVGILGLIIHFKSSGRVGHRSIDETERGKIDRLLSENES